MRNYNIDNIDLMLRPLTYIVEKFVCKFVELWIFKKKNLPLLNTERIVGKLNSVLLQFSQGSPRVDRWFDGLLHSYALIDVDA